MRPHTLENVGRLGFASKLDIFLQIQISRTGVTLSQTICVDAVHLSVILHRYVLRLFHRRNSPTFQNTFYPGLATIACCHKCVKIRKESRV